MSKKSAPIFSAILAVSLNPCLGHAEDVLREGDFAIAFSNNSAPESSYPRTPDPIPGESVVNVLDGDSSTKYLNFGKEQSGFIVTPATAGLVVKSLSLTTANDFPDRDPFSFILYGTNDEITSEEGGRGDDEDWIEIAAELLDPPEERFALYPIVNINNNRSFTSYRLVFDTIFNEIAANSMQIADVQFFTEDDASGTGVLAVGDPILSIDLDMSLGETPAQALDGDPETKYLNFGGANSGIIVTPESGTSVVQSLVVTTANDAPERDPATFILYGTNDPIVSTDNSRGDGELWTEIARAEFEIPIERFTETPPINITNSISYTSYRLVFDTLIGGENLMQIADIQFYPEPTADGNAILGRRDSVLAIDVDFGSSSAFPENENPLLAVDQFAGTKYLNLAGAGSGLIITPGVGASTLQSFTITTANDEPGRDPATYILEGTNDAVNSAQNSFGDGETWVPISSGELQLSTERFSVSDPILLPDNTASYTSYKITFDTIEDPTLPVVQIADIQFNGLFTTPQFTQISRNPDTGEITLQWDSKDSAVYVVEFSTDLLDWDEENAAVNSLGTSTQYVPTDSRLDGLSEVFFRFSESNPD